MSAFPMPFPPIPSMPPTPMSKLEVEVVDNSEQLANQPVFRSFGEQLCAVARSTYSNNTDKRLEEVHTRAQQRLKIENRAAGVPLSAGASEMVPSDGGFLVEPEFARKLVERMYLTGQILRRCFEMPTVSSSIRFPQLNEVTRVTGGRLGGVQVWPQNESSAGINMFPDFRLSELHPQRYTGYMQLSNELYQDSAALDAWATYAFSTELAFTLEDHIVNGTGAGQALGVLNSPCLITVPETVGQASKTIINDNVLQMTARMWAAGRPNAIWLYNQNALAQLSTMTVTVQSGGSQSNSWHFAEDENQPDTLCGIPAYPSEYCQTLGTPGDLILADFSRYVVAFREKLRRDVSVHVLFLTDQSAFKFIMRADGKPLDNFPVTPKNGTATTSPFVTLGQR